jgi:ABC-type Fe3+-hydroxamate transport system substrate-binding protein
VLAAADALARVADLLGVAQAGDDLAARIRAAVATPPERRITTFCPVWRDPWIAVGTDTVAGDLLAQAGFTTVPEAPRYPRVELDDVRALAPQVVLLPSEPYEFGERDLAAFDGWDADVRFIDGQVLTWWGPRTPDAVAALRALAATCRPVAR